MSTVSDSNKITKSVFWKMLERFGFYVVQFVLQIVLAVLLDPDDYGCLALMVIFTNLANVFIQRGFNAALIQNKDVTEEDYSSVFWVTISIAVSLYVVLFIAAPWISIVYKKPNLTAPFRVICLLLFPGAYNSIQLAKASRSFDFRSIFLGSLSGSLLSGALGIFMAYKGFGLWALVAQTLSNLVFACIFMQFTTKWYPRLVCNIQRVKVLFRYGWKLLVSGLIDTGYADLCSLIVGIKYSTSMLGYYNRGQQFPMTINNVINGAVQSVMLPALSEKQGEADKAKALMRNSIIVSSFMVFPMMAGLAVIARPLVLLMLKEKWVECVPFLQISCITLAFYPVHSCNLQAINAMGRSDIFLKLEIYKKIFGLAVTAGAVLFFNTPLALAWSGVLTTIVACFINASPNKKLMNYSYVEQFKDYYPSILLSLFMCVCIYPISFLHLGNALTMVLQIVAGMAVYAIAAAVTKVPAFRMTMQIVRNILSKRKKA